MLFQLHWQNRADCKQTEFVAQTEDVTTPEGLDAAMAHLLEVTERRIGEMPEGWCPMVCDEGAECFERAVNPHIVMAHPGA